MDGAKTKDGSRLRIVKNLLNKRNLCTTQEKDTDACQGDSGGPLYFHEGKRNGKWVIFLCKYKLLVS